MKPLRYALAVAAITAVICGAVFGLRLLIQPALTDSRSAADTSVSVGSASSATQELNKATATMVDAIIASDPEIWGWQEDRLTSYVSTILQANGYPRAARPDMDEVRWNNLVIALNGWAERSNTDPVLLSIHPIPLGHWAAWNDIQQLRAANRGA